MPTAAPACKAALAEATRRWPGRATGSDGILSSSLHQQQNPDSDHDYGNAWDLTHDPGDGCDAHALVRSAVSRRDRRVKYAISQGRIWSRARAAEGWRTYTGSNPHNAHAHVSIFPEHRGDTSPWFTAPTPPTETRMATKAEVQAMLDQSEAQIMRAVRAEVDQLRQAITGGVRQRDAEGRVIDPDPSNISIADAFTKLEGSVATILARLDKLHP